MLVGLGVAVTCFAQTNITVTANVEATSFLDFAVSRVTPGAAPDGSLDDWEELPEGSGIGFGPLTYDPEFKIFTADIYYAVDVGVVDNSGAWTLTHTVTSMTNGVDNLNDNINVSVAEIALNTISGNGEEVGSLNKVSYTDSNGLAYNQASIGPGHWFRFYYGVGTGNDDPINGAVDNPGVVPVDASKSSGPYSGTITLTLS